MMNAQSSVLSKPEIEQRVRELGPWFHNMDLHGVRTAPDHFLGDYPTLKWRTFADALPADLHGRSVLDIGCNGGFFSLEMKRRGAERVLAIDTDERYLRQAEFASQVLGLPLELARMSVYELSKLEQKFDLVLFTGVFYHLRYPLLALDLVRKYAVGDLLVFQSMLRGSTEVAAVREDYDFEERAHFDQPGYPRMHFIERRYAHDPTNWWVPNRACAEALLRSAGFDVVAHPEAEVYVCRAAQKSGRYALELELAGEVLP
jgi:tRNA (mo5U34)-methyltransferase